MQHFLKIAIHVTTPMTGVRQGYLQSNENMIFTANTRLGKSRAVRESQVL